jgi:RNA polymerase sigma factor (sigma-70 family)
MEPKIKYSQQELLQGCLLNDRRMQKALYDQYKDAMYTICYRILNQEDSALDAVQEGFIAVFKGITTFKGESTIGAWIKTIITRSAFKQLNKQKIQYLEDLESESPIIWPSEISKSDLQKAINSLPPGAKMVFILAEVEGYSHKEISDLMNISTGTSKSQLFAAKSKLKTFLSA